MNAWVTATWPIELTSNAERSASIGATRGAEDRDTGVVHEIREFTVRSRCSFDLRNCSGDLVGVGDVELADVTGLG